MCVCVCRERERERERRGGGGGVGGVAVNSGRSLPPSAHNRAELCRVGAHSGVGRVQGLNETSVEAEPRGEKSYFALQPH